jgi:hypothetical protein
MREPALYGALELRRNPALNRAAALATIITKWFSNPAREALVNTSSHHLLVVANQTATNEALVAELRRRQDAGPVVVHLVVAALNTRVRHWLSDFDEATSAAHTRVDNCLEVMRGAGIALTAEAGDCDPLSAISDALAQFPADEVLICTLPVERSHWLERDIIGRAEELFPVPVTHIIAVDQPERARDLVGASRSSA